MRTSNVCRRRACAALIVLVACAPIGATDDEVEAVIRLVAHPMGGSSSPAAGPVAPADRRVNLEVRDAEGVATRVEGMIDGAVSIPLSSKGEVRVACDDPSWWSPWVTLSRDHLSVVLDAYPAGHVTGVVSGDRRQPPPAVMLTFVGAGLDIRDLLSDKPEAETALSPEKLRGEADCTITGEGRFDCLMPVGRFAARLRTPELAARFLWRLEIEAERPRDLGELHLYRAATLTGTLISGAGQDLPPQCRVELAPEGGRVQHDGSEEDDLTDISTDGHFQVQGVASGLYQLHVECEGFSGTDIHRVNLVNGRDVVINDPIVLSPAFPLEGDVLPPLSPHGELWRVQLVDRDHRRGLRYEALASGSGRWKVDDIQVGYFDVNVMTDSEPPSMRFKAGQIDVHVDPQPALVDLELVAVEGTVRFGYEPLEAAITFGLSTDPQRTIPFVSTRSGQDGKFETWLCDAGWQEGVDWPWPVIVESVRPRLDVERVVGVRKPDESGKPARLDITIPNTRVTGRIVDTKRRPVEGAHVLAEVVSAAENEHEGWFGGTATAIRSDSAIVSDSDGRFEIVGLPKGRVRVRARDDEGRRSRPEVVDLAGDSDGDFKRVELILDDLREVTLIVDSGNQPVTNASIDVRVQGSPETTPAVTDAAGTARTTVPSSDSRRLLMLSILPPGRCLSSRAGYPSDEDGSLFVDVPTAGCGEVGIQLPHESVDSSLVVLAGEGGSFTSYRLDSWMRSNTPLEAARQLAATVATGQPFVLPRVAPGIYMACLFSSLEGYYAFLIGGVAQPGECLGPQQLDSFGSITFDFSRE